MASLDKLAQQAVAMGKSSSEFKAAAQRHANVTWFCVIVAGVTWYFLGWAWALILIVFGAYTAFQSVSATMVATRLEKHEQSPESTDTDFVHIVQAYGRILETSAPVPGSVADASKLPYPKHQIKDAIIAALRSTDDPRIQEHLKVAYIQLSDWQEGVGESNQGLDASTFDMSQDTEALAKSVLGQSVDSERLRTVTQREQEMLKQELLALGLW
jgi:hypothetical protein